MVTALWGIAGVVIFLVLSAIAYWAAGPRREREKSYGVSVVEAEVTSRYFP